MNFKKTFGFALPAQYQIDQAADEAVEAVLIAMDKDEQGWSRMASSIELELRESSRQGEVGRTYAAKRVFYEAACNRRKSAYNRLFKAARLAARLGFSEPSIACAREIWYQEEQRRTKQTTNETASVA